MLRLKIKNNKANNNNKNTSSKEKFKHLLKSLKIIFSIRRRQTKIHQETFCHKLDENCLSFRETRQIARCQN